MVTNVTSSNSRKTVVTGGSSGIGLAVVNGLLSRGHDVTVFDLTNHPDPTVPTEIVNVVEEEATARAVERTRERYGGLTGLVASHGTRGVFKPALEMTADEVRSQFDVHAIGSFIVAREFARVCDGSGSIVFVSSTTAYGGWANQVDYGLAKAAVSQLTKNLAIEWAPRGIRVNAVAPGHTLTPMVQDMVDSGYDLSETERRMPLGRLAQPEEIAHSITHLLDDATFVTGQCLAVDGGWTSVGK